MSRIIPSLILLFVVSFRRREIPILEQIIFRKQMESAIALSITGNRRDS
jgi:hypothetical protein